MRRNAVLEGVSRLASKSSKKKFLVKQSGGWIVRVKIGLVEREEKLCVVCIQVMVE